MDGAFSAIPEKQVNSVLDQGFEIVGGRPVEGDHIAGLFGVGQDADPDSALGGVLEFLGKPASGIEVGGFDEDGFFGGSDGDQDGLVDIKIIFRRSLIDNADRHIARGRQGREETFVVGKVGSEVFPVVEKFALDGGDDRTGQSDVRIPPLFAAEVSRSEIASSDNRASAVGDEHFFMSAVQELSHEDFSQRGGEKSDVDVSRLEDFQGNGFGDIFLKNRIDNDVDEDALSSFFSQESGDFESEFLRLIVVGVEVEGLDVDMVACGLDQVDDGLKGLISVDQELGAACGDGSRGGVSVESLVDSDVVNIDILIYRRGGWFAGSDQERWGR